MNRSSSSTSFIQGALGSEPLTKLRTLSRRQLALIPEVLEQLYSPVGLEELPKHIFETMSKAVPCELMTLACHNPQAEPVIASAYPHVPGIGEIVQGFRRHSSDHPVLRFLTEQQKPIISKVSDFLTIRQFRNTGLFHDVYRPIGWKYQMGSGYFNHRQFPMLTYSFVRGHRDFTEGEKLLTFLLGPHLMEVYAGAWTSHEVCNGEVIYFDPQGYVVHTTLAASTWLREYFGEDALQMVPPIMREWAECTRASLMEKAMPVVLKMPEIRVVKGERGDRLVLRLVIFRDSGLNAIVVREERRTANPAALHLSQRQAEILSWIAQGKTNEEIGVILGVSKRTIEKHTEAIYERLGVENRTSAAALAFESGLVSMN